MQIFDSTIKDVLEERLKKIEQHFQADAIFYYGELSPSLVRPFRDFLERLSSEKKSMRLAFLLNTPGGSVESAEKIVEIVRYQYAEVYFVVPDFAMSAGTILCMSGDKIYMDYSSSLGPIDPQVFNGERWVPARGYLDKVDEMIEKARKNQLTNAEFLILQKQDLAELRQYEQARDLSISLLKKWLVEYKFRPWTVHRTDSVKKGQQVTLQEKEARAEQIASDLGSNSKWLSHSRMIGVQTLSQLRLEIDDYSNDPTLRPMIRSYNDLLTEYIARHSIPTFLHSRNFF
jgi:membrane-bound ClpP family serine protease